MGGFGQNRPAAQVELVKVESRQLSQTITLPADLAPYQSVAIYPKIAGFLESITVDRGSSVEKDELIATITAPELLAQRAEAESKVHVMEAQRIEAQAKLLAAETTYRRLKAASETPGVVAGLEVELAERAVDAERARVQSLENSMKSAQASVKVYDELFGYLRLTAPFDGVVTERLAHPGALVGPSPGPHNPPLVRIEQISQLRLVVPVPEAQIGSVPMGARLSFSVSAFPEEKFQGTVRRSSRSLDLKTRTMLVELDVANPNRRLTPGMYAEVSWPLRRTQTSLFVPTSAVVTTTERRFVVRVKNGIAEWVDVRRGVQNGDMIEVFGDLREGDVVVRRGTDELRPGTSIATTTQTSSAR
jgi:RND family efflux transporter MFP subunit